MKKLTLSLPLRILLALVLLLALAACASTTPPLTAPSMATDTPAVTAAPTVSAGPETPPLPDGVTPTVSDKLTPPTPEPDLTLLPAPLYFLSPEGQIMRLEADGSSPSPVTSAESPITAFDVSQTTGAIAYAAANEIHVTDANGKADTITYTAPDPLADAPSGYQAQINSLHFSPGGRRIAFYFDGVQVVDIESGEVSTVQANDPPDSPGVGTYQPVAWSPDGSRLLISRAFYTTAGTLQVNNVGFENVVFLGNACCQPAWSADGRTIYVSGPYDGPRAEPGLRRYDMEAEGALETLIASGLASDGLHLVSHARLLANGNLYSFQTETDGSGYSEHNGIMPFTMLRTAADGVSAAESLRPETYTVQEALWADDGSGVALVPATGDSDNVRPVLWLPTDDSPASELPATVALDASPQLRWGATPDALDKMALRATFLADTGITLAPEGTYEGFIDVAILPLETSGQSLWAVHTTGMRFFGDDAPQPHALALYTRTEHGWQRVALTAFDDVDGASGPDYLDAGSVAQVQVEPDNLWLEMHGGVGAHSGVYRLLRFDGEAFTTEAYGFSSSPGAGQVADLNEDGVGEVLLDATDYYVFCYACGVRYPFTSVLRWDGEVMTPVELALLGDSAVQDLRQRNNQAVEFAQAGLWKDALALLPLVEGDTQTPDVETAAWNTVLIRLNGEAQQYALENEIYPILENLFYGDYLAAVEPFRVYMPEEIFAQPSVLVTGTVAEGWEDSIWQRVNVLSDPALEVFDADRSEEAAAAYFLRAWAAYIVDSGDPAAFENIARTVQLAPGDPLYEASYAYLKGLK